MKKFFKITIISLFFILFALVTTELLLIYDTTGINVLKPKYINKDEFRHPAICENPTKKSVILMGCSFFHDIFLDEKYLAHTLISQQTKRNVYNLAIYGSSPVEALYILKDIAPNFKLKDLLNNDFEMEHVIYNYMPWHAFFIQNCPRGHCPQYKKNKNGELTLKYNFFHNTEIYNRINYYRPIIETTKNPEKLNNTFATYMLEMQKAIKKQFGENTKFTILVVKEWGFENWEQLKKEGINVVNLNEILGFNINTREYAISDTNRHPNEKAWEVIVPALIKELDL